MKNVFLLAVVVLSACAASKPIDPPGETPPGPGAGSPGSPASAWSTQGGPASPGSPSMGTITTTDAGADSGKR